MIVYVFNDKQEAIDAFELVNKLTGYPKIIDGENFGDEYCQFVESLDKRKFGIEKYKQSINIITENYPDITEEEYSPENGWYIEY